MKSQTDNPLEDVPTLNTHTWSLEQNPVSYQSARQNDGKYHICQMCGLKVYVNGREFFRAFPSSESAIANLDTCAEELVRQILEELMDASLDWEQLWDTHDWLPVVPPRQFQVCARCHAYGFFYEPTSEKIAYRALDDNQPLRVIRISCDLEIVQQVLER